MKHSQGGEWEKATMPAFVWRKRKEIAFIIFGIVTASWFIRSSINIGPVNVLFGIFIAILIYMGLEYREFLISNDDRLGVALICPCGKIVPLRRKECGKCARVIPHEFLEEQK